MTVPYLLLRLCCALAFLCCSELVLADGTLQVQGRFLTTPCGDTVVLRGVNKLCVFDANNFGIPIFPEIKKTGANVLRIVWSYSEPGGTVANLDKVIQACIDNAMIPMVEMHDATGDWSKLNAVAEYWLTPEMIALVKKHEKYLLLNIANEAGDFNVKDDQFQTDYSTIINNFRNAGIAVPLIIDADGYGQNIDVIINSASKLISTDAMHNLIFSLHAYWDPKYFENPDQLFTNSVKTVVTNEIPFIIGEYTGCYTDDPNSTDNLWKTILSTCQANRIGWLAWEWGPGNADYSKDPPVPYPKMDMTADGNFSTIKTGWAKQVLSDNANSVAKTSITPDYIKRKGECLGADVAYDHASASINIHPQPADNELRFSIDNSAQVELFSALGQRVNAWSVQGNSSINTQQLSSGVYTLLIRTATGTIVRSISIQH